VALGLSLATTRTSSSDHWHIEFPEFVLDESVTVTVLHRDTSGPRTFTTLATMGPATRASCRELGLGPGACCRHGPSAPSGAAEGWLEPLNVLATSDDP
jgi:hypothetical protein